jgi:hypothetical protein
MILLVTGWFAKRDKYGCLSSTEKEFLVSHGIDGRTMKQVTLDNRPPWEYPGAYFHAELQEWVID